MDFSPTAEQRDLTRNVRSALSGLGGVERARTSFESDPSAAEPVWTALAVDMGLVGLGAEEKAGGAGYLPVELCMVHEILGRHLSPVPFLTTVLTTRLLSLCAADPVRDRLLADALEGRLRLTELLSGRIPPPDLTVDRTEDGRLIVTGTVDGIWNADTINGVVTTAVVDGAPVLLHVPVASGWSTPQPTALDLTRLTGQLRFDGVEAHELEPGDDLDSLQRHISVLARLLLASEQLGVAAASIDAGAQWARDREQFGRPIGSFQAIKHRLVNAYNDTEGARTLVYLAAWSASQDHPGLESEVDEALLAANDAATRSAGAALQVHGGIGFTWEHDSHLYLRRSRANSLTHSTRASHLERIAARILDQEK